MIYFEWDEEKSERNLRHHGMAFPAVRQVFDDIHRITLEDSVVDGELRWRTIGMIRGMTVVIVVHLEDDFADNLFVRIISARRATPQEGRDYEQNRAHDIR